MNKMKTAGKARIQVLIAAMAMLSMVQTVSATLVSYLSDDFESYTGAQASTGMTTGTDLRATLAGPPATTPGWDYRRAVISTTPNIGNTITLFPDPTDAANQTLRRDSFQADSGRIERLFDGVGTRDGDAGSGNPSTLQIAPATDGTLYVMWRFYDSGGSGSTLPLDLLTIGGGPTGTAGTTPGAGTLTIGVGLIPTLNGRLSPASPSDNTKYQASIAYNNNGPNFNLATSRLATPGWVTFELQITATATLESGGASGTLFVNGTPDANFTNLDLYPQSIPTPPTYPVGGPSYGRIGLGHIMCSTCGNGVAAPVATDGSIPFVLWDDITVSTVPALLGDYNNDGNRDAADYVVWRKNEGTMNVLPNDPHGGTIGPDQYDTWVENFGEPPPPPGSGSGGSVGAAPEPSALFLIALGAAFVQCGRRNRRQIRFATKER